MGRKIPAKKHRGVKDPAKQQEQRWKKLKTKINAPPRDPDEQPAPRSLARLFGLPSETVKEKIKRQNITETNSPQNEAKFYKGKAKVLKNSKNPVSSLKRLPGESGRAFSLRINSAIHTLNDRTDDDYFMDLNEEDDVKGDAMMQRNQRRAKKSAQKVKQAAAAEMRARGGGSEGEGEGQSGGGAGERAARGGGAPGGRCKALALKKKAKKEKEALARSEAAEVRYERVQFGEVAHAPPALTVKPRRAHYLDNTAPRPGSRPLLLTAMLTCGGGGGGGGVTSRGGGGGAGGVTSQGGSTADSLRRERARLDAVAAYRMIKKHKHANTQATVSVLM